MNRNYSQRSRDAAYGHTFFSFSRRPRFLRIFISQRPRRRGPRRVISLRAISAPRLAAAADDISGHKKPATAMLMKKRRPRQVPAGEIDAPLCFPRHTTLTTTRAARALEAITRAIYSADASLRLAGRYIAYARFCIFIAPAYMPVPSIFSAAFSHNACMTHTTWATHAATFADGSSSDIDDKALDSRCGRLMGTEVLSCGAHTAPRNTAYSTRGAIGSPEEGCAGHASACKPHATNSAHHSHDYSRYRERRIVSREGLDAALSARDEDAYRSLHIARAYLLRGDTQRA